LAVFKYERINGSSHEHAYMDKVTIIMEAKSPEELVEVSSTFMAVCLGERSSFYASEAEAYIEKETE